MIYVIIMILACCAVYPIRFKNKETYCKKSKFIEKLLLIVSFFIALFPMGLRYGIGTDYFYTYLPHFYGIARGTMEFSEIGFNIINKIIFDLTGDYRVLFFVTSFIFLYFIYKGIYENSNNLFISIMLIFIGQSYFYSMNMVRQAIAISIIFYAFKYMKENKRIKYILCCIIASLIHVSAILMIPFIFIFNFKLDNKKRIILVILLLIFQPVIEIVIKYIIQFTPYAWYYTSQYNTGTSSMVLILTNIIIFMLNIFYYNEETKEDKEFKILTNINFIGMCIILISSSIPLVNRLVRYFTIFQILLIPKIFEKEKNQKLRIILKVVILGILFIAMYYQIMILGGEGVYPYKSIFDI